MSEARVLEAVASLRAVHDELDACDFDTLDAATTVAVLDALAESECRAPAHRHRALTQLRTQTTATEMGAKSWRDVLRIRWRISSAEAGRWLTEADLLGPRPAVTGSPLAPIMAATAVAQRLGFLTAEHVSILRKAIHRIPAWVDAPTREQIEVDWVRHAVSCGPQELEDQTRTALYLLDQDGTPPDDAERRRRRAVTRSRQGADLMTEYRMVLTPQAAAVWEVLLAKYAAPGMCNPADQPPCTHGTPSQAQIDGDTRSLAQRQHDAMEFIGRHALDKGELGQLGGLPTSILVRTTLQDLHAQAGLAVTGGGTLLPVGDVLQMAAQANTNHYLGVFDGATDTILNFFRARRTASTNQRLAMILRDGGCTKPACTVPAYGTQAHHAVTDWAHGGHSNVNDMSLACGPDNRDVTDGGWTTRINDRGQTEWIPPPQLDTGQKRTNDYHHRTTPRLPPEDGWTPEGFAAREQTHTTTPDTGQKTTTPDTGQKTPAQDTGAAPTPDHGHRTDDPDTADPSATTAGPAQWRPPTTGTDQTPIPESPETTPARDTGARGAHAPITVDPEPPDATDARATQPPPTGGPAPPGPETAVDDASDPDDQWATEDPRPSADQNVNDRNDTHQPGGPAPPLSA